MCFESIQSLMYKLRIFGIPLVDDQVTNIFCDNDHDTLQGCNRPQNNIYSEFAYH